MFKELIHYMTLSRRSKKRLFECIELISKTLGRDESNFKLDLENGIKNMEFGSVVGRLIEQAEKLNTEDYDSVRFWSTLKSVAVDHKMIIHQMEIDKINGVRVN